MQTEDQPREYYFEARSAGIVYVGYVNADDEEAARQLAREKYPQASSIKVALVDPDGMLERFAVAPDDAEGE